MLLIFLVLFPSTLPGKAYYAGKKEMIEKAEAIAIVKITHVERVDKKGSYWTYHQRAMGIVEKSLKGTIRDSTEIYGMENFICAKCEFHEGLFLLFLRKDGGFWVCSNWHLGIRAIKAGQVEWFKNEAAPFESEERSLEEVIREIGSYK